MAKRRKKRSLIPLLLILILAVGCVSSYIYYSQSIKAVSNTSEEVEFKVNAGDTSADILQHLKNENLIKDVNVAKLYIRLYQLSDFKSGTFVLNRNMDLRAILEKLNSATAAASDTVSVTVTEGDWAKHIAEKIAAVTNVTEEDLLKLWNDKEWISSLKSTYSPSLSGITCLLRSSKGLLSVIVGSFDCVPCCCLYGLNCFRARVSCL